MILARSPYYIISNTLSDDVTDFKIELRIWKGHKVNDKPVDPTTTFTVQRPNLSNTKLSKDISPHIRDFFINETVTPFNESLADNQDNIVWVDWVGTHIGDTLINDVTGIDFATEGYTEFKEGLNSDVHEIIMNADQNGIANKKMLDDGLLIVPILNGNKNIKANDINGAVLNTSITASDQSSEQIHYIRLNTVDYDSKIEITTDIAGIVQERFNFDLVCENKFEPTNIVFKNKFGAYENIYFFKKPVESVNTESTEFINNVSGGLPYNTTKHQFKKFGLQSKKTLKAMTGYVSDLINPNIEQLVLSENVFIQTKDDLIPINVKTESLEFQTQLVEKKVNYEFEFEYAYNKINSM